MPKLAKRVKKGGVEKKVFLVPANRTTNIVTETPVTLPVTTRRGRNKEAYDFSTNKLFNSSIEP